MCSANTLLNTTCPWKITLSLSMSTRQKLDTSACLTSAKVDTVSHHTATNEVMGKTFQAAQLTHERFLTMDHSCKIFFWYLPNWTSTDLWCVVLYVKYSTTHQRSVEVQFGRYQKNILQEWSMVKNLSCVSCAAWNIFPINSLTTVMQRGGSKLTSYS